MPRSRSSGALSIESNDRKTIFGLCFCSTLVIAAVSVVLPWSMCPIVPTFTCGFDRSNFSFAIAQPRNLVSPAPAGPIFWLNFVPVDLPGFLVVHESLVLQRAVGRVQLDITPRDKSDRPGRIAGEPSQPHPRAFGDPDLDAPLGACLLHLDHMVSMRPAFVADDFDLDRFRHLSVYAASRAFTVPPPSCPARAR